MPQSLCLCTECRLITGGPAVAYIDVPASTRKTLEEAHAKFSSDSSQARLEFEGSVVSFDKLKGYSTSPGVTRFFCTKCGSHFLCHVTHPAVPDNGDPEWVVATGVLDRLEGLIDWKGCYWVGDTLDGGIAQWLPRFPADNGGQWKPMSRYIAEVESSLSWEPPPQTVVSKSTDASDPDPSGHHGSDTLKASCLCKSIRFTITRPTKASTQAFSPYPDLMIPYHSGPPTENTARETWFLRANNTKYLAGLCTCPTCRYGLGMPIQAWAFVPRCNILMEDGSELDFAGRRSGAGSNSRSNGAGLVQFSGTEDTYREFCGTCGANIFWHCGWRPDIIDVSAGILDPALGARCESWLEWWHRRVSFREIGNDVRLADALEAGLKEDAL